MSTKLDLGCISCKLFFKTLDDARRHFSHMPHEVEASKKRKLSEHNYEHLVDGAIEVLTRASPHDRDDYIRRLSLCKGILPTSDGLEKIQNNVVCPAPVLQAAVGYVPPPLRYHIAVKVGYDMNFQTILVPQGLCTYQALLNVVRAQLKVNGPAINIARLAELNWRADMRNERGDVWLVKIDSGQDVFRVTNVTQGTWALKMIIG